MPFTFAVGSPISTDVCPTAEGSLGLFFLNGSDTSTVYFLTARHVAFPRTTRDDNKLYEHKNQSLRRDITIFGKNGIVKHLNAIRTRIGKHDDSAKRHQHQINTLEGKEDDVTVKKRKKVQTRLDKAQKASETLEKFYDDTFKFWNAAQSRTIGFITLSPPIAFSVGDKKYTEDWAIGQLDANKINTDTFFPNILDLGFEFEPKKLDSMMNPNSENPPSFKYPDGRLLHIRGIVSDDEIQNPTDKDKNGDPLLMVLKRGKKTGLTVGRTNNVKSFIRKYWKDSKDTSTELAVHGLESVRFSDHGDSGAVVVDGTGRVVGMVTGGVSRSGTSPDINYVTPAEFIFSRIKNHGLNPNIDFSSGAQLAHHQ